MHAKKVAGIGQGTAALWLKFLAAMGTSLLVTLSQAQTAAANDSPATGAPIRLRQPTMPAGQDGNATAAATTPAAQAPSAAPNMPLSEFERYVSKSESGSNVRRLGTELALRVAELSTQDIPPIVPPDYIAAPGDEVLVTIWGSLDADLRLVIDRAGKVSIPRVGSVMLAGVRHADIAQAISQRASQVFKNFQVSASLGALRGIRVYVTGFAQQPGAYQISSLSSLSTALFKAGGPAAGGSYRQIDLRRNGKSIASFDLYDFILKGDRSADQLLQAGDVIQVGPVGLQVAILGSVNRPTVVEFKPGEKISDVLKMAGGFSPVADRQRLILERLGERSIERVRELKLPDALSAELQDGDVLRAVSAVDALLPNEKQNKRVRVEGEVARPGDYVLPATATIGDAVKAAGGLTANAFPFGTEFSRESVRRSQQENYERALRDLEAEFLRVANQRTGTSAEDSAAAAARSANTQRLLERMRAAKPNGRVVLEIPLASRELPDLLLEQGDRIFVPSRPTEVGVFGSVFNAGSYLFMDGRNLGQYTALAGGPTRAADQQSVFVIRANGMVVSGQQRRGWFGSGFEEFASIPALPGDTIFVPEDLTRMTTLQIAKDWTQILFQFGVGIAGIKNAIQ